LGIVHCFFKNKDREKEIVDVVNRMNGKFVNGIGIKHKSFLEVLEKKIIQRIKLRHDPFWKINKGKIVDSDGFSGRGFEEKKFEEKSSGFEKRGEKESPEKEIEGFIDKIKGEEVEEVKGKLLDYEKTFKSELGDSQREKIEGFVKQVPQKIIEFGKDVKSESVDKDFIKNIMTNKFSDVRGVGEDVGKMKDIGSEKIIENNLDKSLEGSRGKVSKSEKSMIDEIMMNKFGIGKKEDKNGG